MEGVRAGHWRERRAWVAQHCLRHVQRVVRVVNEVERSIRGLDCAVTEREQRALGQ